MNKDTKKTQDEMHTKFHWYAITNGVIEQLKPHLFVTLLVMSKHMDANGVCYPAQETIAEYMGTSRRSIIKNLKELLETEINGEPVLVKVGERQVGKGKPLNVYKISACTGLVFGESNQVGKYVTQAKNNNVKSTTDNVNSTSHLEDNVNVNSSVSKCELHGKHNVNSTSHEQEPYNKNQEQEPYNKNRPNTNIVEDQNNFKEPTVIEGSKEIDKTVERNVRIKNGFKYFEDVTTNPFLDRYEYDEAKDAFIYNGLPFDSIGDIERHKKFYNEEHQAFKFENTAFDTFAELKDYLEAI